MQLTQKEVSLLKDMRNQEKLCIDKYSKYAAEAHDPQLRQLFDSIAGTERAHLDMLNQIEAGQSPRTSTATDPAPAFQAFYPTSQTPESRLTPICVPICCPPKSMCRLCTTPACLSSRRMICARCSIGFRPTSSTMVSSSGSI